MAIVKKRVSELPYVQNTLNFEAFVLDRTTNQSAKISAERLRGNTGDSAFDLWLKQPGNAGKSYEDYLAYNRQPATEAAERISQLQTSVEQAESSRVNAEQGRISAEQGRTDAESNRAIAEGNREEAETIRSSAEETRISTENARIAAELERSTAEQQRIETENERVTSEETRQSQEQQRQTNTATAIRDSETATDRLNTLSDHRDEIRDSFWWHWNEETGEYENTGEKARGDVMYATFEVDDQGNLLMTTPNGYNGPTFDLSNSDLFVLINE